MNKKAVILLADGFEEVEATTPIDFLRRAGLDVCVAGVAGEQVTSSHGLTVGCDCLLSEVKSSDYDAVIIPGGMPGAANVAESGEARRLVTDLMEAGKLVSAICAAPAVALEAFGVLKGKKATCYPGFEKHFSDVRFCADRVVVDDNLITSRGPGTAAEFALALISYLAGSTVATQIAKDTLQK
ncbi:DJ-1 family glyoxalase III [Sediminispirochaeta bajacaliforniensis]|uniref:DJ-1 family glyoxalase III n=1 Tax=Sediminispirochaeta bajacaliforniensis TaxID=148 RepID=UPI00036C4143|nr:DJ-1 family glyoxalase III [Sediminispirochaeta bajacaliforniensis]